MFVRKEIVKFWVPVNRNSALFGAVAYCATVAVGFAKFMAELAWPALLVVAVAPKAVPFIAFPLASLKLPFIFQLATSPDITGCASIVLSNNSEKRKSTKDFITVRFG